MSYDLAFWRERDEQPLAPQKVYERLLEGNELHGLEAISVEDFLAALAAAFPDGKREPNGAHEWFVWVGPKSMFEAWWSATHVMVTMRPLDEDNANRLIDVASTFGMPLYDLQTAERFDSADA